MNSPFRFAAGLLLLAVPAITHAELATSSVTPDDMRRHIEVLASDAFEGRQPGTRAESKTVRYIAGQLQRLGLQPAAKDGSWYQPVGLVESRAFSHRASWGVRGKQTELRRRDLILVGRGPVERVHDAPVFFVGHGAVIPDRNIDQIRGASLKGAAVLMLREAPPGFPTLSERTAAVAAAGASAIILIQDDDVPWAAVRAGFSNPRTRLQMEPVAAIQGAVPFEIAARLVAQAGGRLDELVRSAGRAGFGAVPLEARASFEVSTEVRSYTTHNVLGRIRGSGKTGESVLYLGHWDHLGICRPEGADRICNGAVDNASGIAMLIEIAARLANGARPQRDILVMATTAEEMGLLGARFYAANPTVPLKSIVAALNVDTVAIHGKGEPVAVIGHGIAPLDRLIAVTAAELGRKMDEDAEADAFVTRQDGWALARAGVPAVMVGGSFSDVQQLGAFLSGPYHKPDDDLGQELILEGAAEDAALLIALGRKLANPKLYQPEPR